MRFEHRLGAILGLAAALQGCGSDDEETTPTPTGPESYVLVHGAFAGAWCWDDVIPTIEAAGDSAITVELPAHGDDTTPPADATLDGYTARVVAALDAAPGPVILVGHSMGGLVVSQAAEQRPAKVKKLVYLAAFLVDDGTSLLSASAGDDESHLADFVTPNDDGTVSLAEDGVLGAFCSDCSADQADLVASHLRTEPLVPFTTGIHTTAEAWGSVPRVYIETLQDQTIGPARQKSFYEAHPCEQVLSIDAGHCPFITQPDEVANALLSI